MTTIVVTGTDTDVGKTVVTAALAARFNALGRTVAVVKPAQTGVSSTQPGDLDEIRRLAGGVTTYEGTRLQPAMAPDVAARIAGATLPSLDTQRRVVAMAQQTHDVTLIEGAGGVLVRLGDDFTLVDLVAPFDADWLVVTRSQLGTLNHTGLTVLHLQSRQARVAGLVIGAWPRTPESVDRHNLHDLPRVTGIDLVGRLPQGASSLDAGTFRRRSSSWFTDAVGAGHKGLTGDACASPLVPSAGPSPTEHSRRRGPAQ